MNCFRSNKHHHWKHDDRTKHFSFPFCLTKTEKNWKKTVKTKKKNFVSVNNNFHIVSANKKKMLRACFSLFSHHKIFFFFFCFLLFFLIFFLFLFRSICSSKKIERMNIWFPHHNWAIICIYLFFFFLPSIHRSFFPKRF